VAPITASAGYTSLFAKAYVFAANVVDTSRLSEKRLGVIPGNRGCSARPARSQCGDGLGLLGVLGTFDTNVRLKSLPHSSHLRVTSSIPDVAEGMTDTSFARAPQSGQRSAKYAGSVMTRHHAASPGPTYIFDHDGNNKLCSSK
jgi:hypothetical protein